MYITIISNTVKFALLKKWSIFTLMLPWARYRVVVVLYLFKNK